MTVADATPAPESERRYASRKWRLAQFAILAALLSRALDWIDGATLAGWVEWVIGLYMAGNVTSAVADKTSIKIGGE